MLTATLALSHKDAVLDGARRRLGGSHARGILDVVFRAVVARLGDAPVAIETIAELRASASKDVLLEAARALGRALVDDMPLGGSSSGARQREVERALASVLEIMSPPASLEGADRDGAGNGRRRKLSDPSATLITALCEIVTPSVEGARLPDAAPAEPRALLRVRATTIAAALDLALAVERAALAPEVMRLPAAPDELLLTASGALGGATLALVRAAQAIVRAVGSSSTSVCAALVEVSATNDADGADERRRALVGATVRAGKAEPGLLALDEACWRSSSPALAEVPGKERCVEPTGPFRNDRWETSALLLRPAIHGRDDDAAAVASLLTPPSGRARLLLLHGPSGIGKTTVLRLALRARSLDDDDAPILWGGADGALATPYAAFVGMVRALAAAPAGHPRARARLVALVDGLGGSLPQDKRDELSGLCPVLAYLIGAVDEGGGGVDPEIDAMSPRALQVSIRRAALLVVEALRERAGKAAPVVLVITGAEGLDAPTQDLLAFLGRRLGQELAVVLVSTTRLRISKALDDRFFVARHEVRPLPPVAAHALLESALDEPVAEEQLAPLVDRARGSPLALAQLLRFAVEGGFITRHSGHWDLSGLSARDLPGRVERALARRVRRLPDDARRVLGCCALLGLSFRPTMVEHVAMGLGLDAARVRRALTLLTETGCLVESIRRPAHPATRDEEAREAMLSFEHPTLRPAAAEALDDDQQGRAHRFAAEAFERFLLAGSHAVAHQLARHLRLAGEHAAAVRPLTVAVRRAVRLDDRAGAQALAREGLGLVADDDAEARFDLELEVERALEKSPQRDAHAAALRRLARLGERTGDPRRQGRALLRVARFNLLAGDADRAEEAARRSLEFFRFDDDARAQQKSLRVLALSRLERRDLAGAAEALTLARALTPEEDARARGMLDHQRGLMRLESGDPVGALEHLLESLELYRSAGDLGGEGAALDAIAQVYVRTGRPDRARALLERAVEVRDRIGDDAGRAQSTLHLGEAALTLGDVEGAERAASAARELARAASLDGLERSAALLAARAALARQDADAAEALIEQVRRRVDDRRDPYCAMEASLLSARAKELRAHEAQGAARDRLLKTALRRAREASALGESHGWVTGRALGAARYAEVLAAMGDGGAALPWAQRAVDLLEDGGRTGLPAEEVFGAHARVCEAAGDVDEARASLQRAVKHLEARAGRLPDELRAAYLSTPSRAHLLDALRRLSG